MPKSLCYLKPLSFVYGICVNLRNFCYDHDLIKSYKVNIPVICVGNVVSGGTGKTPFVQYLVELLLENSHTEHTYQPAVLLRGYRGKIKGPAVVLSKMSYREVGDEAVLHRNNLPDEVTVVVARDRLAGAQFITENKLGNIIVMDDGFQHRRLKRDIDIVLINESDVSVATPAVTLYKKQYLLPTGLLREPPETALKRASFVVVVHKNATHKSTGSLNITIPMATKDNKKLLHFNLAPKLLLNMTDNETVELSWLQGREIIALSALGRNDLFANMLYEIGASTKQHLCFPDHWSYSKMDLCKTQSRHLPIVTTEKDFVKLKLLIDEIHQEDTQKSEQENKLMLLKLKGSLNKEEEAILMNAISEA